MIIQNKLFKDYDKGSRTNIRQNQHDIGKLKSLPFVPKPNFIGDCGLD